jgi:hypothetical protein
LSYRMDPTVMGRELGGQVAAAVGGRTQVEAGGLGLGEKGDGRLGLRDHDMCVLDGLGLASSRCDGTMDAEETGCSMAE